MIFDLASASTTKAKATRAGKTAVVTEYETALYAAIQTIPAQAFWVSVEGSKYDTAKTPEAAAANELVAKNYLTKVRHANPTVSMSAPASKAKTDASGEEQEIRSGQLIKGTVEFKTQVLGQKITRNRSVAE